MENDLQPMKILQRILKYWWALILIVILGGVVGIGISRIHSPVYQSRAVITTVIDYSQLGKLDDYEEDQIFVAVGETISSSDVLDSVFAKVQASGIQISREQLKNALILNRQDSRWLLTARYSDPATAQKLAQTWADESMQAIERMITEATKNFLDQQYLHSLVTCLQNSVNIESGSAVCNLENFQTIQSEIDKGVEGEKPGDEKANLILLHTTSEITQAADYSGSPVLFKQNYSALAGMILALVLSLILFSIDFPFFVKNEK
jgi:capsular polysaccharide biosynthesis protein